MSDAITGDMTPEFRHCLATSAHGFKLFYLGQERFEGSVRYLDQFVQADSPNDEHYRVNIAMHGGNLEIAKLEALVGLHHYILRTST